MNTADIMLDLETLGAGSSAAVVAIGACIFDPYADEPPTHSFEETINVESAMRYGQAQASTIVWWMRQSEAARNNTFPDNATSLNNAVARFASFVKDAATMAGVSAKEVSVWGNGATFDNVVIRNAFNAVGIEPPWSFRRDKCYRTVINLLPVDKRPEFKPYGTAHVALDDAIAQALHLQKVVKLLNLTRV